VGSSFRIKVSSQDVRSAGLQPKLSKIAPMVAGASSVAVFVVRDLSEIPCSL
jgi:hypothetical protein